MLIDLETMLA